VRKTHPASAGILVLQDGEDVNLMSVNRERTVACTTGSKLSQVVNEAIQANPPLEPSEHPADAVA
jgi:hypothetical protein